MRQSTQTCVIEREVDYLSTRRRRLSLSECRTQDECSRRVLPAETATPTLLGTADHGIVVAVGAVVVRLHLHSVLGAEHLRVLAVSQEVLVVLLQVPKGQPVLLHPQGLELHSTDKGAVWSVRPLPILQGAFCLFSFFHFEYITMVTFQVLMM